MKSLSFLLFFITISFLRAQELNIDVNVSVPNLKLSDPALFTDMENDIREFINNTQWTDDAFEPGERIEGSIQFTITEEYSTTSFAAEMIIQAVRPVYNTSYTSSIINHIDKNIQFSYDKGQPINVSTDSYTDNLSSLLTYYCYVILGLDYDSFSPLGGEDFFQSAQNVISSIPPSISQGDRGWQTTGDSQNRYWMVENFLNPRIKPFRQAFYEYHRLGMDLLVEDVGRARASMLSNITMMGDVSQSYPNSLALQVFINSKRDELVEVFKVAGKGEKRKVYNIMVKINPANADVFRELK